MSPSETSDREFLLVYQENRGKEKGKWSRKEGKSKKGRWKIDNGRRKSYKMRNEERTPLFFFFLFFVFCFCFAFHSSKPLKFVLGVPKWEFSTRKNHFSHQEKWLCPLWKIFLLYTPLPFDQSAGSFQGVKKLMLYSPTDSKFHYPYGSLSGKILYLVQHKQTRYDTCLLKRWLQSIFIISIQTI